LNKKQIIYSLVIISFVLIIINIYVDSNPGTHIVYSKPSTTIKNIETNFLKSLHEHGIKDEWISTKKIRKVKNDSLLYTYSIEIPKDLTIVSLISDISVDFKKMGLEIKTEEKKNYSNSILKIFAEDKLKLQANLIQSKDKFRDFAKVVFLIEGADFTNRDLPTALKTFKIPVNFLFIPSQELIDSSKYIAYLRLSYALLLNDDIEGAKFELDKNAQKNILSRNIKNIVSSFGKNKLYVIEGNSSLYNSVAFNFVVDEFEKRGVKLVKRSDFIELTDKPFEQILSLFEFHCDNGKLKDEKVIIIDYDDFLKLQPAIKKQKKIGDKFYSL